LPGLQRLQQSALIHGCSAANIIKCRSSLHRGEFWAPHEAGGIRISRKQIHHVIGSRQCSTQAFRRDDRNSFISFWLATRRDDSHIKRPQQSNQMPRNTAESQDNDILTAQLR
jgi:hypothetical protein